jgi:hypothetical protein
MKLTPAKAPPKKPSAKAPAKSKWVFGFGNGKAESGRNCQVWLGAPSSPGNSRSPARARWSTHPDVPSPVHPWKMRLPFPNPFARHWLCGPLVHRTGAEARGACAGGPVADSISAPREAQCPQRRRAINFGTHKGEGRERRKCSH